MAQALHNIREIACIVLKTHMLILTTLALGGCVIPPDLQLMQDGGVANTAPWIKTAVTTPRPNTTVLHRKKDDPLVFAVSLVDDEKQVLSLRFFKDREYATEVQISRDTTTGGVVEQDVIFTISGFCDQAPFPKLLELYVSDNGFVSSGSDLRKVNEGGLSTSTGWDLTCQ